MTLAYRKNRINKISKSWKLKKEHSLMLSYKPSYEDYYYFKKYIKMYISKAMDFQYEENDKSFLKLLDKNKKNLKNITPNGAVVPKREFQLEYNLIIRQWCHLIKKMTSKKPKLLKLFRMTPNIRIKFGSELEHNKSRPLNTAIAHSDAWLEGPWGFNCFMPIVGDIKNNYLKYYELKNEKEFREEFLKLSKTYNSMSWVNDYYKDLPIKLSSGIAYISDYSLIHKTHRKAKAQTRVSVDTTIFVGNHLPFKDRLREYRKGIPLMGIDEIIDAGQYENDKFKGKISTFSHYTGRCAKTIRLK